MPRAPKIESQEVYRRRLGSRVARDAIRKICGGDDLSPDVETYGHYSKVNDTVAPAKRLLEQVSMSPGVWKLTVEETLPEIIKRRARLAAKLRAAARALADDTEHEEMTLLELRTEPNDWQLHFLDCRATNRPTLVEVIFQTADQVVKGRWYDAEHLPSRRGADLKAHCLLALHTWISTWPKYRGYTTRVELQKDEHGDSVLREIKTGNCRRLRSPNRQIELLIGELLQTKIKPDTLTHLLGPTGRRKYEKDPEKD